MFKTKENAKKIINVKILVLTLLLVYSSLVFAQNWTSLCPESNTFHTVTWNPHNEGEILMSYEYTIFKTEDHMQNWSLLYSYSGLHNSNSTITDLVYDIFDENVIYMGLKMWFSVHVSEQGVYKSTDGGLTFEQIYSTPLEKLIIHPQTGKLLVNTTCSWLGVRILTSNNGGVSWIERTEIPFIIREVAFDAENDNILYATSFNQGTFKSLDNGLTWDLMDLPITEYGLCKAHPENGGELWVGTNHFWDEPSLLYHTVDGGESWTLVDIPNTPSEWVFDRPIKMVFGTDTNNIYLGEFNEILKSSDGGTTWTSFVFDNAQDFLYSRDIGVNPFNDDDVILIGEPGLWHSTTGGDSWNAITIRFGASRVVETTPNPLGGYYLYSAVSEGVKRYCSVTETWDDFLMPGHVGYEPKAIGLDPARPELYLEGRILGNFTGAVHRSLDYATTNVRVWDNMAYASGHPTEIFNSFSEPGVFYMTTWEWATIGELRRSEDWGVTWDLIDVNDVSVRDDLHLEYNHFSKMSAVKVSYTNPDILYVFGDNVMVIKSTDRGETFTVKNNGLPEALVYNATISPFDHDLLLISHPSGLFRTTNGAETWENIYPSVPVKVKFNPAYPGMVAMVTVDCQVLMSFNNGDTWTVYGNELPFDNFKDLCFSPDGTELLVATNTLGVFKTPLDLSVNIPQNLSVSVEGFNAHLTWNEVSGASRYGIYRNNRKIGESETNSFTNYYLLPRNYNYKVTSIITGIVSEFSNTVMASITGSDLSGPENLSAEIQNYRDVLLSWEAPLVGPQTGWVGYCDGENDAYFSSQFSGFYDIAMKFDTDDLDGYDGFLLTEIKFFTIYEYDFEYGSSYRLKVWTGQNAETLIVNQEVSLYTGEAWNTFTLDTPVVIDASTPLWVGYNVNATGLVAAVDAGPAVASGKSNLFKRGTNWSTLDNIGVGSINANWNLQAFVINPEDNDSRVALQHYVNRDLAGYNIYRDGELIHSSSNPEVFEYLDTQLDYNTYIYSVTAVYSDGESVPAEPVTIVLTNNLMPPLNVDYEINNDYSVTITWEAPVYEDDTQSIQSVQHDLNFKAAKNKIRTKNHNRTNDFPQVIAYNVYRDNELLVSVNNQEIWTYTDTDVLFDTEYIYTVTVVYEGDEESPHSESVQVIIESPYHSPKYLRASTAGHSIELEWEMPWDAHTLRWDNGRSRFGLGYDEGGTVMAGVRFAPEHLIELEGQELKRVYFFPRENYSANLKIFSCIYGTELVFEQFIGAVEPLKLNEIILDTPIIINSSVDLWIAIEFLNTAPWSAPFGMDTSPANETYGDLFYFEGVWYYLSFANFIIRGEVVDSQGSISQITFNNQLVPREDIEPLNLNRSSSLSFSEPALYNVEPEIYSFQIYRDDMFLAHIENGNARAFLDDYLESGTYTYHIIAVYEDDIMSLPSESIEVVLSVTSIHDELIPSLNTLHGNYPNPFNPKTNISFSLNREQKVSIEIYNIKGQKIKTLVNSSLPAKKHTVTWHGDDDFGKSVGSGVYFYKMITDNYTETKKMLMLK